MTTLVTRPGKTILPAILLLALSVCPANPVLAQEKEPQRSITWLGYNEGLTQGRDFDKPVFLHFTAPWCKWCRKMKRDTYADPKVIRYMSENFAAVMIDTEKLPSLSRKYGVRSLPTLWFLDSRGNGLTSIEGYMGPEKMLRVLEYIGTKAYQEVDYQTWVRKHAAR